MGTELRQRKSEGKEEGKEESKVVDTTVGDKAEKYVDAVGSMAPQLLKPYFKMFVPVARILAELAQASIPIIAQIRSILIAIWIFLKPYKPDLLLPAFIGIVMCFFGGSFMTLIAAAEAYKMCSHETIMKCIHDLGTEFDACLESNEKDDKADADGNGIADTVEITPNELVIRKTALFFKTVDPKKITEALTGLNAGGLAIIATLKLQFAKAITLGSSMSTIIFEGPAKKYVVPALEATMPPDYQKWAAPLVQYTVKTVAVSLAWYLQRIMSAVHAALRGSKMCADNVLDYLMTMNVLTSVARSDMKADFILSTSLAAAGMYFQFSRGFSLPFPLNLIMMPFSIMEYFLMWAVNRN